MKRETCVMVVDDDQAARESLRWLLESVGHKVVCYSSADEFLDSYSGAPGCLVLDVRMPGMSGLELQREVDQKGWCLPTILVTGHGDVPMAVRAMRAGAVDFLQKPYNDQILLERAEQALASARERWEARKVETSIRSRYELLTKREREISALVRTGNPSKIIAAKLGLSCKTVEIYRGHMMSKMAARGVAELIQMLNIIDGAGGSSSGPGRYSE